MTWEYTWTCQVIKLIHRLLAFAYNDFLLGIMKNCAMRRRNLQFDCDEAYLKIQLNIADESNKT